MDGKCKDCKFSQEITDDGAEKLGLTTYAQYTTVMCFRYPPQWIGVSEKCLTAISHKEGTCGEFKPREG